MGIHMELDDVAISRAIIEEFYDTLLDHLEIDVGIVGAGPSGLACAAYLARGGAKAAVFERKLSVGGGMWGGKTKIGISICTAMGCCSLCDELPSLYAVKLICLFRSSAKDGCTRYEDFQSCYSTESMWHYRPSSERIQPLTGAPHEADFPFGNRWCQMVLAKFWQSQLGDPT
jgi:hypothetical protein